MSENIVIEIIFALWNAEKIHLITAEKIFNTLKTNIDKEILTLIDLRHELKDLQVYGNETTDKLCLAFGSLAASNIESSIFKRVLPDIKLLVGSVENKSVRAQTFNDVVSIAKEIETYIKDLVDKKKKEFKQTYVEVDGVKVGLIGTDILITESEAEYLKRIKDLLGGSKIVITKGDLKIEVS